jgi:hypothetical protein
MYIEETQHEGVKGIACVLYNTKVVTYFEDGRIRLDSGGYRTQSTAKFMQRLLGRGCVAIGQRGHHLRWHVNGSVYKIAGNYNHELWLDADLKPINPLPFIVHAVDRVAMKEVKAKYAPFLKYAIGLGKLTEWAKPESSRQHGWRIDSSLQEGALSGDLEVWAAVFNDFVEQSGRVRSHWAPGTGYTREWVCNQTMFQTYMREFIKKAHRNEVFVKEALPIGEFKLDTNIKYRYA